MDFVAVTAEAKLDARKLRADFPIFEQEVRGKPLAYLDSAVSAHKPRQVLDKLRTFYETSYANVHRGVYTLSERATAEYESARDKVARFVNAPDSRELIFTHGATESINLVAYAWGLDNLGPGDIVLVTELEHHSNYVPWQYVAKRTGAEFRMLPPDDQGELRLDLLDETIAGGTLKIVGTGLVSDSLGTVNPIGELTPFAYALDKLADVPGIELYGPSVDRRAGIVSFNIEGVHPHDVGQVLGLDAVAIRGGHHCCQPLMQKLGVVATNRASFYLYTVPEEIDQLVDGLHAVRKVFA